MHKYETNLASEFYVLAALYRLGMNATLSLGNKKSVDITIVRKPGEAITVDVKGVAGKWDWPADNIALNPEKTHFLVLVSFEGKFEDPSAVPSVWVLPHAEVEQFRTQYQGRSNISRAKLSKGGDRYRNHWDLLRGKPATQS